MGIMIQNEMAVEKAVLSSYIFASETSPVRAIKLDPKDFIHPFHKLVATCLNWLIENNMPTDELMVMHYIAKNNRIDEAEAEMMIDIMTAQPFANIKPYIEVLRQNAVKRRMLRL